MDYVNGWKGYRVMISGDNNSDFDVTTKKKCNKLYLSSMDIPVCKTYLLGPLPA